ncbi:OsmC family protein [Halomicroarcula sp. GCM10025324]|uniref:OsmC family protein n=1 Tax=Haloarcula TaxID=2237 RepID=UPI0023E82758|nr:OsmC family protein [Halomicroarcula sp. ZS-22-S1]
MSDTADEDVPDELIGHDHAIQLSLEHGDRPVDGRVRDHTFKVDDSETLPYGGHDLAPSAVDYMVIGLAGCQLAVLSQALRKARIEDFEIEIAAIPDAWWREEIPEDLPENQVKRIEHIEVSVDVTVPEEYESRAQRCLDVYDEGCIVGQSFRAGVEYTPNTSLSLKED